MPRDGVLPTPYWAGGNRKTTCILVYYISIVQKIQPRGERNFTDSWTKTVCVRSSQWVMARGFVPWSNDTRERKSAKNIFDCLHRWLLVGRTVRPVFLFRKIWRVADRDQRSAASVREAETNLFGQRQNLSIGDTTICLRRIRDHAHSYEAIWSTEQRGKSSDFLDGANSVFPVVGDETGYVASRAESGSKIVC